MFEAIYDNWLVFLVKEGLTIPKAESEAANRRSDYTMDKCKGQKIQNGRHNATQKTNV